MRFSRLADHVPQRVGAPAVRQGEDLHVLPRAARSGLHMAVCWRLTAAGVGCPQPLLHLPCAAAAGSAGQCHQLPISSLAAYHALRVYCMRFYFSVLHVYLSYCGVVHSHTGQEDLR